MVPTVLLYNLDSEKGRGIKLLCLVNRFRARPVSPEEYGLTLRGLLAGEQPPSPEASPAGEALPAREALPFTDEMLVMAGFTSRQVDVLLQGMRKKKLGSVALKAVLTATNAEWDSVKLHGELALERQAVLRGESAHGDSGE